MAKNATRLAIEVDIQNLSGLNQLKSALRGVGTQAANAENDLKGFTDKIVKHAKTTGNSINSLESQKRAFEALRRSVDTTSDEFKRATAEVAKLDEQLKKAETRKPGGRLRAGAQIAGTVAGAGVFGGPEGAIGALGGAVFGGAAGAVVGGAIGAQVGQFRKALGGIAEYGAELTKLRIALRGVTADEREYNRALQLVTQATKEFVIPQSVITRQFTRLQASVSGAGGNLNDTNKAFRGIVASVRATGGSIEDVNAALTATSQVFSKGKVSAEELRQQIGERLPGAFTLFAESIGKTPQELDKALERGEVTLQDFLTFSEAIFQRYGETAQIIADGPEGAGDRLKVSLEELNEKVAPELTRLGAQFQNFANEAAGALIDLFEKLGEIGRFLEEKTTGSQIGLKRKALAAAQVALIRTDLTEQQRKIQQGIFDRLSAELARYDFIGPIPSAQGGLSADGGGGDSKTAGAKSKRIPASQRLVDLTKQLADAQGKYGASELATLRYMVARQKILDNNTLPATDRQVRLNELLVRFKKEALRIEEREAAQANKRAREDFRKRYGFALDPEGGAFGLGQLAFDPESPGLIPGKIEGEINTLQESLKELIDPLNQIKGAAQAIGEAFSSSFTAAIDGSVSAQQALADFFRNVGNYFLDMAGQIIQKMIQIAILNSLAGLLPSSGGFGGLSNGSFFSGGGGPLDFSGNFSAGIGFAKGGAFDGGLVTKPTMFAYANGGIGNFGLMGEAGPEAIMPLRRDSSGRLGVDASGGGKVNVGVINIKVENTGDQLNPAAQKQLAGQVKGIVLSTLANERRSGGML